MDLTQPCFNRLKRDFSCCHARQKPCQANAVSINYRKVNNGSCRKTVTNVNATLPSAVKEENSQGPVANLFLADRSFTLEKSSPRLGFLRFLLKSLHAAPTPTQGNNREAIRSERWRKLVCIPPCVLYSHGPPTLQFLNARFHSFGRRECTDRKSRSKVLLAPKGMGFVTLLAVSNQLKPLFLEQSQPYSRQGLRKYGNSACLLSNVMTQLFPEAVQWF